MLRSGPDVSEGFIQTCTDWQSSISPAYAGEVFDAAAREFLRDLVAS